MALKKNLVGQTFERLTVIEDTGKRDCAGGVIWKCKCSCGNFKETTTHSLVKGTAKSCGCLRAEKVSAACSRNLIGQKFGLLTVIKKTDKRDTCGNVIWECKCDCGNSYYVRTSSLTTGATKSCGCLGNSYGEKLISQLLTENNISFITEKTFPTCKFKDTNKFARFDFFINNQYLIEYDGEQHYRETPLFRESFQSIQEHDAFKTNWCKQNNIPLIRIPYTHIKNLKIEDLLLESSNFIDTTND